MSKRLAQATAAAALAVVLLSGTGGTMAAWSDSVERGPVTVSSGRLVLDQGATDAVVLRTGQDGTQELPVATPLVPGDVVRVTSTVVVRAEGDALRARLGLDHSALGATVADVRLPVAVSVHSSLASAGEDAWIVTAADDGTAVTAVVEVTVPVTTDGRDPAADRTNWWGERLQHQTLHPGAVRWTLTQETP